ncbi:transporter [Candidatus Peregrinibacteria bacterium CG10_big_fil_rev_8_21_14_0_10_49_24]|nr:MAG: transporter [Candidatus Peregrinibacteria bacterium CG11_big_fil_rev_8_21_14_0_20_49_14]PIR50931.1 MAG: transporter [Candidatus Peregrinibacteria bacterium CG10_big_fil_rev_8_21_14_0_10_49_24]PJA67309.1 MAG: transporter [Candidatus Peregrinibacteria bacterium CG_4_9_14_3_um_filter_49_12]
MWLYFALLTPLFFAIVHVLDMYCVDDIFEEPWIGVVTSALASLVIFLPLPYLAPVLHWSIPSTQIILLSLSAGALIQFSQFFYFQALSNSEAGIVAAYWNIVPALIPIVSFFIFKEVLTVTEYVGIFLLVGSAIFFCLLDSNLESRWNSFVLMFVASCMQVTMFLIADYVFENIPYLQGFYLITSGLILAGLSPLLLSKCRKILTNEIKILTDGTKIFIAIELVNLAALACSQRAVSLGIPSLVAAVESTIPAYTFVLSIILVTLAPKYGDPESKKHITSKFTLVGVMTCGVFLVS